MSIGKRTFDFFLALLGLVLSFPFWLLFSFLIWSQSKGPISYLQERIGKDGRIFKSIKFRSMIPEAEKGLGPVQAQENDPRVTKLGRILRKTALDELPQLINILKGEMSFVGPRALRPQEQEVQDNTIRSVFDYPDFKERSKVRPGLTGVAQIFGTHELTRQKKFKYDLWYIKNQSLSLDLYLMLLSFLVTFRGKWNIAGDKLGFLTRGLKSKIESEIGINQS